MARGNYQTTLWLALKKEVRDKMEQKRKVVKTNIATVGLSSSLMHLPMDFKFEFKLMPQEMPQSGEP